MNVVLVVVWVQQPFCIIIHVRVQLAWISCRGILETLWLENVRPVYCFNCREGKAMDIYQIYRKSVVRVIWVIPQTKRDVPYWSGNSDETGIQFWQGLNWTFWSCALYGRQQMSSCSSKWLSGGSSDTMPNSPKIERNWGFVWKSVDVESFLPSRRPTLLILCEPSIIVCIIYYTILYRPVGTVHIEAMLGKFIV